MISALLRCWLKKKHLQSYYHVALQMYMTVNVNDFITIEIIIRIFELMTKSTSLLMTDKLEERAQFLDIIKKARRKFQMLLDVAINVASTNFRSRSATSVQRNSQSERSTISSIEDESKKILKSQDYCNDQKRSNMHMIIHYETMTTEYDMLSNINVLVEKNKHR